VSKCPESVLDMVSCGQSTFVGGSVGLSWKNIDQHSACGGLPAVVLRHATTYASKSFVLPCAILGESSCGTVGTNLSDCSHGHKL
jgi:hypothetical protein